MGEKLFLEVEDSYEIIGRDIGDVMDALVDAGFKPVADYDIIDIWLPAVKKSWTHRIRAQHVGQATKYFISHKKTLEKQGSLRVKNEKEERIGELARRTMLEQAFASKSRLPMMRKSRRVYKRTAHGHTLTAVIDEIKDLGRFDGFTFEVERMITSHDLCLEAKQEVRQVALEILMAAKAYQPRLGYKQRELSNYKKAKIYLAETDAS